MFDAVMSNSLRLTSGLNYVFTFDYVLIVSLELGAKFILKNFTKKWMGGRSSLLTIDY